MTTTDFNLSVPSLGRSELVLLRIGRGKGVGMISFVIPLMYMCSGLWKPVIYYS